MISQIDRCLRACVHSAGLLIIGILTSTSLPAAEQVVEQNVLVREGSPSAFLEYFFPQTFFLKIILKLKSALISVFNKDGLEPIAKKLNNLGVIIYSTGGTELFLKKIGIPVLRVEDVTGYPSILGGRVKTLHPKIFGGILNRNDNNNDVTDLENFKIPNIDVVIVDLYPFEETVKSNDTEQNIIEKIDIGGISLIRAAAKNYNDVTVITSPKQYKELINELNLDWRYGAAYFEKQLIDYDVAANWGNWQYIAGVGQDVQGGRHFHIRKQTEIYDPEHMFIDKWT